MENNDIKAIALLAPFNSSNELLLIQRNKSPRKGYYSFVGGHAHTSENLYDAVKREVKEELKCDIEFDTNRIIRVKGKDNVSTTDDFFFDVGDFRMSNIKGMHIETIILSPDEIAYNDIEHTNYNLFNGKLLGKPKNSNEVKSFRFEKLSNWINLIETGTIKIQPIDYLLLRLLANERTE
ncbi:NUDIX hydrolase [Sporocytophaga myxococcoides]|uniref:NUDIX hydrolase n=1 Tax=Sporocytophaga myxococcoides TaxID=153721 RepID=UPI0003FFBD08|nr:NUDIX hydrolase [Sporocytophaga myxococcoides]